MSGLPFSAVVGQDDAKHALLLAAIDPHLGGVLLRGHKGSAKTTLARALARLLPGDAPFVELPLGATEDRVLGSLDLAEMLANGEARYRPGLFAAADGGVLYVDEVNLLADHLVDVLLDVAVSGTNRVEREGISHTHPARFTLVASMNPEEGELRPQLLDRFGLAVDIETSTNPEERAAAVAHQLDADRDPHSVDVYRGADDQLRARLDGTTIANVPPDVIALASRVGVSVGAQGLRADLMLCRAAAAHAGWEGRAAATDDDLRAVAPFVLSHRRRRTPFEDPGLSEEEIDQAFAPPPPDAPRANHESTPAPEAATGAPDLPPTAPTLSTLGRRSPTVGPRGRLIRDAPLDEETTSIAAGATAIAVATRRAADPDSPIEREDLRAAVREQQAGYLVVLVVDTSSSMGAQHRIAVAKGVVLELLTDAYQHRDRVALVSFRGEKAEIVLRPTGSVEIARARLADLAVGGATPLADAIDTALGIAQRGIERDDIDPFVVVLTDGRATAGGADPLATARAAAERVAAARLPALVIDAESGPARLGLAAELATALGASCVHLDDFESRGLGPYLHRDRR